MITLASALRLIRTAVLVSCAGVSVLLGCQHVLHYASNPLLLFELDAATGLHDFMRTALITAAAVVVVLPAATLGLAAWQRSSGSQTAAAGLRDVPTNSHAAAAAAAQQVPTGGANGSWHEASAASPKASSASSKASTTGQGWMWWACQQREWMLLLLYLAWNIALLVGPLLCFNRSDIVWVKHLPQRYQNPPNAARWVYAVGAAAAWPLVGNMALALVLASRSSQLLLLMGVSDYRSTLWLHRTAGAVAFGWTCVHGVCTQLPVMVVHYATFAWLFWDPTNNFGFRAACANAAWGAFIIMAAAALPPVRRLSFGTFKFAHLLLWPVIILGTMHMSSTFSWLLLPVILNLADVGLRNTLHYSQTMATAQVAPAFGVREPGRAAAAAAAADGGLQVHLKQGGAMQQSSRGAPQSVLQRSSSYSALSSPRRRPSLAGLPAATAATLAAADSTGNPTEVGSRPTTHGKAGSRNKVDGSLVVVSIPTEDMFAFNAAASLQGAYILLHVPAVSGWEWHPFSIACVTDTHLLCVIKARGDWTRRLAAGLGVTGGVQLPVCLEGPYGAPLSSKVAQQLASGHKVMLAAGGIGITTMLQVLQDAACAAGTHASHPALLADLTKLHLVWVVRTPQEPDLLLPILAAAAHNGVLISIFITSAKAGGDVQLCPSTTSGTCLPAAVCVPTQAASQTPHVVWPILLRGVVLWAAAVGAIGGYMVGPALCSVGTLDLEPATAQLMEAAYNGRVAHNYGLAMGYNSTRPQLLPNGTWPAGQKRFTDAKLYACWRLGGSVDWVMWRDNLAGWKYGQPAPVTDMSCWACPPVVRLLLCFICGALAAVSTGGTIRWLFHLRQYMRQRGEAADKQPSCHDSRDTVSAQHIHGSSSSRSSVHCTSNSHSISDSRTGRSPTPVPGRACRAAVQLEGRHSPEPGGATTPGGVRCFAGRPCWATCLKGFLDTAGRRALRGHPQRPAGDPGEASIPYSNVSSRQLGALQERQGVRSGSAAAVGVGVSVEYLRKSAPTNSLVPQEEQQGPAAAYQVYVCGPGTMAAAVGRALNKVRHSSGGQLAAPVLLHNINQSL